MVGDRVIRSLELKNSCPLSVTYKVYLENLLPKAMEKRKKKGLPFSAFDEIFKINLVAKLTFVRST